MKIQRRKFEKSKLSGLRGFLPVFYAPRGRDSSHYGLFSTFMRIEGLFGGLRTEIFEFQSDALFLGEASPGRLALHLGEGEVRLSVLREHEGGHTSPPMRT